MSKLNLVLENLQLVLSNDLYYVVSDQKIEYLDLVYDGIDTFIWEDNRSLLGLKKVVSAEYDLGYVSIKEQSRLFDLDDIHSSIVPVSSSFLDEIYQRGGEMQIVDIIDDKFVITY